MNIEDMTKLINDIKVSDSEVDRTEMLTKLLDGINGMNNSITELTEKNSQLTIDKNKYAQLNNDLFLKIGAGTPPKEDNTENEDVAPIDYSTLNFD